MQEAVAHIPAEPRELPQDKGRFEFWGQAPSERACVLPLQSPARFLGKLPPNRLLLKGLALGHAEINQVAEDKRPFTAPPSIDQAPLANWPALAICPGSLQAAIWPMAKQTEGPAG